MALFIMAKHSDNDGKQGEQLTDNGTPGVCCHIVYKPCRRGNKTAFSDVGGVREPISNVKRQHADNRQHLYHKII